LEEEKLNIYVWIVLVVKHAYLVIHVRMIGDNFCSVVTVFISTNSSTSRPDSIALRYPRPWKGQA